MKLIIQIPCHNEKDALPLVLQNISKRMEGFSVIETMVIDDGSTDGSAEVAKRYGADHVVKLPTHQGLARAFYEGLQRALESGADVIVNIDADNEHKAADIERLARPVLMQEADIVIGARNFNGMSRSKAFLERFGSFLVGRMVGADIQDAVCGFRAYSKKAALNLFVYTKFTYTLETIIQAVKKGMVIKFLPIETNKPMRRSRLIGSLVMYLNKIALTFINVLFLYFPSRFFLIGGGIFIMAGLALGTKFVYLYATTGKIGHLPSMILMAILTILGFLLFVFGIQSYLIANNRRLLEENIRMVKEIGIMLKRSDGARR